MKNVFNAAADSIVNHQTREARSVDKHYPLAQSLNRLDRCRRERGRSHKQAFACLKLIKSTKKVAYLPWPNRIGVSVSLSLHIDAIQAERILVNDAVNAAVATPPQGSPCSGARPPIAHRSKQLDYNPFKKGRWGGLNAGQQLDA